MAFKRVEMTGTQSFYEENASSYVESTIGIDISALRERFLKYIPPKGLILDAGSGSGRDTLAFSALGYHVEAFDSSPALAELSSRLTGIQTRVGTFENFNEPGRFDGIWACASLLHVSESDLLEVLARLIRALKRHGAMYVSFKEGVSESTEPDGRRFTNLTLQRLELLFRPLTSVLIRELWSYKAQSSAKRREVWVNAIVTRI